MEKVQLFYGYNSTTTQQSPKYQYSSTTIDRTLPIYYFLFLPFLTFHAAASLSPSKKFLFQSFFSTEKLWILNLASLSFFGKMRFIIKCPQKPYQQVYNGEKGKCSYVKYLNLWRNFLEGQTNFLCKRDKKGKYTKKHANIVKIIICNFEMITSIILQSHEITGSEHNSMWRDME